jgi:hypothetical protein
VRAIPTSFLRMMASQNTIKLLYHSALICVGEKKFPSFFVGGANSYHTFFKKS